MLIQDPRKFILDKPRCAVVTEQRFLGRGLQGVFESFSPEELATLFVHAPALKVQFEKFTMLTRERLDASGEVVDILGQNNLVLCQFKDQLNLILLDPVDALKPKNMPELYPERIERVKNRLKFLEDSL